jgi:hypothetical protein
MKRLPKKGDKVRWNREDCPGDLPPTGFPRTHWERQKGKIGTVVAVTNNNVKVLWPNGECIHGTQRFVLNQLIIISDRNSIEYAMGEVTDG